MFYVMYQDNLESAEVVRVLDTEDGTIEPIPISVLHDLSDDGGNFSVENGKIQYSFIKANPLEIHAVDDGEECNFDINVEDSSYICHVNNEEYEGECDESTVLAGFDCVVGKYVYFYLYNQDSGEGTRVKCLINGYDGETEVRNFEMNEEISDGYTEDYENEYEDEYSEDYEEE